MTDDIKPLDYSPKFPPDCGKDRFGQGMVPQHQDVIGVRSDKIRMRYNPETKTNLASPRYNSVDRRVVPNENLKTKWAGEFRQARNPYEAKILGGVM